MPRSTTPTTAKEVLRNVSQAEKAAKIAQGQLKKAHDLLLKNHPPFQVGDVVKVNGWSHTNKLMTVRRIEISHGYSSGYRFVVFGNVNTADGSPGKFKAESTYPLTAAK